MGYKFLSRTRERENFHCDIWKTNLNEMYAYIRIVYSRGMRSVSLSIVSSFLFFSSTFKNGDVESWERFYLRLSTVEIIYIYIYEAIINIIVIIIKIRRPLKRSYLWNDSGINNFSTFSLIIDCCIAKWWIGNNSELKASISKCNKPNFLFQQTTRFLFFFSSTDNTHSC